MADPVAATRSKFSIRIHWSLLLTLPFFAFIMAEQYFAGPSGRITPATLAWGSLLAAVLFASVLLHELSHSWVAVKFGATVRRITLLPIGGITQLENMPRKPSQEFLVAIVGPLTNLVIAAAILLVRRFLPLDTWVSGLADFARWAAQINVGVGAFNLLLPAFPLDGGRLLRSALSARMGLVNATRTAAAIGRALAMVLGLLGLLAVQAGGLWLVIIALFIYAGASAEERSTVVAETLGGLRVRDVMTSPVQTLQPDQTMEDLYAWMTKTKHLEFPVWDGARVVGIVGIKELGAMDRERWREVRVDQAMRRDPSEIGPDAPAVEVLGGAQRGRQEHILVKDGERLVGIVSVTDLERMVRILRTSADAPARR